MAVSISTAAFVGILVVVLALGVGATGWKQRASSFFHRAVPAPVSDLGGSTLLLGVVLLLDCVLLVFLLRGVLVLR